MFEKASRQGLRFDSPKGALPVEDLWTLPIESTNPRVANLKDIGRAVQKQLKAISTDDDDIFADKKEKDLIDTLQLKLDIVKYIIKTLSLEFENKVKAAENTAKRQRIMDRIAELEDSLEGKTINDLTALLKELS